MVIQLAVMFARNEATLTAKAEMMIVLAFIRIIEADVLAVLDFTSMIEADAVIVDFIQLTDDCWPLLLSDGDSAIATGRYFP